MIALQKLRPTIFGNSKKLLLNHVPTNNFWAWLTFVFNRVSKSRIEEVGADRACAEWLMRNGAFVRWKGHSTFLSHYDQLPKDEDPGKYHIQEIDATVASISHHGFPHFRNCKYIEAIKFDRCFYLEDKALLQLDHLKGSLETLLILSCGNFTDKGILSLASLLKLRTLAMEDLIGVRDMKSCVNILQTALPSTNIKFKLPE